MREEERILEGKLFKPGHPDLKAIKLRPMPCLSHKNP